MNESKPRKFSREEVANIEIGHTEVTPAQKWALTLFFLAFISIYPVCQFCYRQPFAEWRNKGEIKQSIKAYETAIEDTSLLRKWLLPPIQSALTKFLRFGNEKVIVGKNGWLFFSGDYEYLINPGFLRAEVLHKRELKGVQPDPCKAIKDFHRQLKERGIKLILVPVPNKPMICSEELKGEKTPLQNPSFAEFKKQMEAAGITVVDLAEDFAEMRRNGIEPFLKTDTHWTVEGMYLAARRLAAAICEKPQTPQPKKNVAITNLGDIAIMLKLPNCERTFPTETVTLADHSIGTDRNSDILLLGDSFANIYSAKALKWGTDGGLAETLGAMRGYPVDAIIRNDAGAFATRQLLANELRRGHDRLASKKVVIWEFAIRELANGDWKIIELPHPQVKASNVKPVAAAAIPDNGAVAATVLKISAVPRPSSAPYKDHVVSIHLKLDDGKQALVYAVSMRDNVWTDASKLRVGDKIKIKLEPWEKREAEFGSWNRSEFDDEELLLMEPLFGEIVSAR
jgi:alginate O-acetyltransferase complex protein AlgJ